MKNIFTIVLLLLSTTCLCQQQLGQNIYSENSAQSILDIDSNEDGSMFIVSYLNSNNNQSFVKVFQLINNSWEQIGSNIPLVNNEVYGAVSINKIGNIIAISAPFSNNSYNEEGYVQVYILENEEWIQRGDTFYGNVNNARFGYGIDLDATGNRLAISATGKNEIAVYDWTGNDWEFDYIIYDEINSGQMGIDINLTPDGKTLVVCGKEDPNRNVLVYHFNGQLWSKKGETISITDPFVGMFNFGGVVYDINPPYLHVVNVHEQIYTNRELNICTDIVTQQNTNNYQDWSLPSSYQLDQLCSLQDEINLVVNQHGGTVFFEENQNYISNHTFCNNGNTSGGPYCSLYSMANNQCVLYDSDGGNCCCQEGYGNLRSVRLHPFQENVNSKEPDLAISNNGNTISFGDPGYGNIGIVNTYDWNGSLWIQRGNSLIGSSINDDFATSISLNGDGNILAVSAPGHDNNFSNSGKVLVYKWDGNNWSEYIPTINGQTINESFGSCSELSNDAKRIIVSSNYGNNNSDFVSSYGVGFNVGGVVFYDSNTNGIIDENELRFAQQLIELKNENELQYLTTNFSGSYYFDAPNSQYEISYYPDDLYDSNTISYEIDISAEDTIISELNFGIFPIESKVDLSIELTASTYVCSMTSNLWLNIKNEGTESVNGVKLELWVNPESTIQNASGNSNIDGNYIEWIIEGDFMPFIYSNQDSTYSVEIEIPGVESIGDILIDSAKVSTLQPNLLEIQYSNNFSETAGEVMCSYDPNDKLALPLSCYNEPLDTIEYTIRFQNTGNYPATTVRLVDTLDLEKLDIMSLDVLGGSHAYEWSLSSPSILEVIFNNINLVDSSVSVAESQGFFKFGIRIREEISDNDPSASPAYIFFDYNPPIVTNEPEVRFSSNLSVNVESNDVSCFGEEDAEALLNVVTGEGPYEVLWSNGETTGAISNLNSGIYSVEITDAHLCNSTIYFEVDDHFCSSQYDGNGDGCVNVYDILDFLLEYGKCTPEFQIVYDGNLDGCSNSEDLLNMLSVYGQCE